MNLYSKIIMPVMAVILTILAFKGKDVWQLGLFFSTFLVLLNLEQIKIFKLGKDGLELERITEKAKQTIDELKRFASYIYKPILTVAPKMGRWDSILSTLELAELRKESVIVMRELEINKEDIDKKTWLIDNFILFDIVGKIGCFLQNNNDIKHLIHNKYLKDFEDKSFNPDIDAIEKEISDARLLDDNIKQILDEARYFKKHKDIKTPSLFEEKE